MFLTSDCLSYETHGTMSEERKRANIFVKYLAHALSKSHETFPDQSELKASLKKSISNLDNDTNLKNCLLENQDKYQKKLDKKLRVILGERYSKDVIEVPSEKVGSDLEESNLHHKDEQLPFNLYCKSAEKTLHALPKNVSKNVKKCFIACKLSQLDEDQIYKIFHGDSDWFEIFMSLSTTAIGSRKIANLCMAMKIIFRYISEAADSILSKREFNSLRTFSSSLAAVIFSFYWQHEILSPNEKDSDSSYFDLLAALLSIYVDTLAVQSSVSNEQREELQRSATSVVLYLTRDSPRHSIDVLAQLTTISNHPDFCLLLVRKILKAPKIEDNSHYIKAIYVTRQIREIFGSGEGYILTQAISSTPARPGFMDWLRSKDATIEDEMPLTRHFYGIQITQFLLREASEELLEQMLNIVTEEVNESKVPSDQNEACNIEPEKFLPEDMFYLDTSASLLKIELADEKTENIEETVFDLSHFPNDDVDDKKENDRVPFEFVDCEDEQKIHSKGDDEINELICTEQEKAEEKTSMADLLKRSSKSSTPGQMCAFKSKCNEEKKANGRNAKEEMSLVSPIHKRLRRSHIMKQQTSSVDPGNKGLVDSPKSKLDSSNVCAKLKSPNVMCETLDSPGVPFKKTPNTKVLGSPRVMMEVLDSPMFSPEKPSDREAEETKTLVQNIINKVDSPRRRSKRLSISSITSLTDDSHPLTSRSRTFSNSSIQSIDSCTSEVTDEMPVRRSNRRRTISNTSATNISSDVEGASDEIHTIKKRIRLNNTNSGLESSTKTCKIDSPIKKVNRRRSMPAPTTSRLEILREERELKAELSPKSGKGAKYESGVLSPRRRSSRIRRISEMEEESGTDQEIQVTNFTSLSQKGTKTLAKRSVTHDPSSTSSIT